MIRTIADETGEPLFFPAPWSCPFSAPAEYMQLRETAGLHKVTIWDGSQHWLANRHADIRAVLGNPALSADVRAVRWGSR
jgi:cytochrome P450